MPSTKKPLSSSLLVFANGRIANLGFLFKVILLLLENLFFPSPKIENTSKSFDMFFRVILPNG